MNAGFTEALYERFRRDPKTVPPDWAAYFRRVERDGERIPESSASGGVDASARAGAALQERVNRLVRAYRVRGHLVAALDPLGFERPAEAAELSPQYYGLLEADLDLPVAGETLPGADVRTVRDVWERLQQTYCRNIGVQYMHMDDTDAREWLQDRMERSGNHLKLSRDEQLRILTRLTDAVIFERFIQQQYIGAKSFSLEGAESLIPLLDLTIERAGEQGIVEIVMGMAHRGRLNVLANIVGKHPQEIFRLFEDADPHLYTGRGDVKYHLGHSGDRETASGQKVHISLCFNPSHLEFVNPVVLGRLRAKQDRVGGTRGKRSMALMIHGDASFAGEGIVQETLNLSGLGAYSVGGALHVIINNQIGFTTPPAQTRATSYATDVARMLQSPVFHVNGEDPESVAQVVRLAMDFRLEFGRDVVIDMYGYRRKGHNEADEPSFTQPLLYEAIRKRKTVRDGYLEYLLAMKGISREEADAIAGARERYLESALAEARKEDYQHPTEERRGVWKGYRGGPAGEADDVETSVDLADLQRLLHRLTTVPDTFNLHPKLQRLLRARRDMAEGQRPVDWSTAEALAFTSLAAQGYRVRLSGQDSERGTFSQRHAVFHDYRDGATYRPMQHVADGQASVDIYNSPLSEAGVLGFEYGYSLDCPDGLVAWEAQFGDFANAAQVIIDQFVTSAEDKWNRLSGLVLLLPHGLEGQGPEHASARVERFLTLAAEDNIQVVVPTTPSQYFHVLRRQVLRRWRKPLVVLTPKSLLRDDRVTSSLDAFAGGRFHELMADDAVRPVRTVLLCSGKMYYDLHARREQIGAADVALVRIEQLYPLDRDDLHAQVERHAPDSVVWVQEEPVNMGFWPYVHRVFGERLGGRLLTCVARPASASPASGSLSSHRREQADVVARAFDAARRDGRVSAAEGSSAP